MAGGMILMGIFGFFLSVPAAMVLHGVAQAVSNGSRIWLYRDHIRWSVLAPYSLGALIILGIFVAITFIPNKAIVFILIGAFPFIALCIPKSIDLDMERKPVALLCGLLVTTAQMLAGASGPVLDLFYVKSSLTRHEILGTKAITQTFGHILKLTYYSFLITAVEELSVFIFIAVVSAAIFGNWLGSLVVNKINDKTFKSAGRIVMLAIGSIYITKGIFELV
jgi:uncharacterized membrane protein YfcA